MAPKPQHDENMPSYTSGHRLSHPLPGEEIVISGMSGSFPDSDNVMAFRENLFNKVDLVSDDDRRWKLAHPEIPQRTGKINHVNKFDASFFGVHFKQAHTMDPMCRILLEKAYEAVVDAGVNPKMLRGTKTGVFIGSCFSESEKTWFYEKMQVNGFGITGCSRAMLANRISYWLGCTGPSYSIDSACSSSLFAVEHAFRAIRDGLCDAALVGGANLCLHPYVSLQFSRLGVLSPEGRCKTFDKDANGYVRAEAINIIFLQKSKDAKRVYAQILHAKTNCDGYKEQGITYPAGNIQKMLLREFYDECEIAPVSLEAIEAHGTGTRVGDPEELTALDDIFCSDNRKDPLRLCGVKSNMGHSEAASGICSVIKVCFAFDTGYIPPNLHYENPREDIPALTKGRMTVVSEKTKFNRGLFGINSFGFGGANAHILLKNLAKEKVNGGAPKDDLPRLICVSGRVELAVSKILDDVESRPVDAEYVRLLQGVFGDDISGHVFRGYTILRTKGDILRVSRDCQYFPGTKRPIWFVFSGMGSQWPGMGTALMKIPIFAAAIERCHRALRPKGIDIVNIITNPDPKMFDNILHSFVGIAAVQIGLCDILKEIGIVPDHIIGHSVGELGCAYVDGCFTAEEMILSAYSRGLASIETPFIKGSMAAVGIGYEEIKSMCPPDIEVACHNGPDSCTISGPADSMKAFVANLQAKDIFAKEVPCSNIAYHSRYIAEAGPTLLKYLRRVISTPRKRSSKWVSTSVPQHLWNEESAQYSSAEYHTNNLLSPVLFEETSKLIHGNAITIEIAPHGLLQAILRRSLKSDCTNVSLTKRDHLNNTEFFLNSIGKLYEVGLTPQMANLYPKVELPVSSGTPMISHLIEWEHSEDWYVTSYKAQEKMKSGERNVRMSIADEDMEYMAGHVVDGRNLYPATGYMVLVWETLGMMMGELYNEISVVFENIRFIRATNIPKEGNLEFTIMIQKGTGNFEVIESGAAIVTGRIYAKKDVAQDFRPLPEPKEETGPFIRNLNAKDFYKEMRLRGYNYSGLFRGMHSCNVNGTRGMACWINNWVTFLDAMLQIKIMNIDSRGLFVPTRIEKLSIDSTKHHAILYSIPDDDVKYLPITVHNDMEIIRCGGVEIRKLSASPITRRNPLGIPVLEKYQFVPNFPKENMAVNDIIRTNVRIALDNVQGTKVKSIELIDEATQQGIEPLIPYIRDAFGDCPIVRSELIVVSDEKIDLGPNIIVDNRKLTGETNTLIFIGSKLLSRASVLQQALDTLKEKAFVISREGLSFNPNDHYENIDIITAMKTGKETLVFLRKKVDAKPAKFIYVKNSDEEFQWLDEIKALMKENFKLVLVAENEKFNGILGLVNCLRREPGGEVANCIAIMDMKAPRFDPDLPLYEDQIDKELCINVFKNGQWGTYAHLPLEKLKTFPAEHAYVNILTRGDLSSNKWVEGDIKIEKEKQLIHIYYSALNFRDIMTATGRISVETVARGRINQECVQGFEFSGKTNGGARIMGMCANRALSNMVKPQPFLTWPIPEGWSLRDAATVPVVYGTAIFGLLIVAKMKRGESVLIHAGSGGVGQAAINICLYYGCKIFTTVGTPEKRAYMKKIFPQIPDEHIGCSRDTSFEEMVMQHTNGEGVNIILNSLADDKLQASIRCLSRKARFVEIGKFDVVNNTQIGMSFLLKEASMHAIMMDFLFDEISEERKTLYSLIHEHIDNGSVKPLNSVVFNTDEIEKSFRYMAAGKHVGKVLVKIRDEEADINAKPVPIKMNAIPRYVCHSDDVYVVIGGLGGFGLELIDWLILRGARKVVINSRRGISNGYQSTRIRAWTSYEANIVINTDNVTTQEGCINLLKTANSFGTVRAIFNLAVILKDAILENQTSESFKESFAPKAYATKFLDIESRKLCPNLKDFVIFSSVSCGRGHAGQTNYGMANSIMERICEERQELGLPALAIQWGAVGDVGLLADPMDETMEMVIGGTLQQKITSCLTTLDQFIKYRNYPILSTMVVAEKKIGDSGCGNIVDTVSSLMGLKDLKTISMQATLAELGMDSMMAVEIKQSLEREFEIFLTAQDIRTLTFAKLLELTAQREAEVSTSKNLAKSSDGLTGFKILVKNVGDELTASEPIVYMPTMYSDGKENDIAIDDSIVTMYMIPGIEGMASSLESVCKRLKCRVTVLQLGYDHPNETIQNIADRILVSIRSRLTPNSGFTILGYSFGVIIALYVAKVLEKEGHYGQIYAVDGSPEFLQRILKANFNTTDEKILQDCLLSHILDIITPKKYPNMMSVLSAIDSWDKKVECFLQHVPENVTHSKQYQRSLVDIILGRLKSLLNYNNDDGIGALKSQIILLRTKDTHGVTIEENYSLQKYSEQPIVVHSLEGNHVTILDNKDCANIINRVLVGKTKKLVGK